MRNSAPWMLSAVYYPATGTGYWFGDADSYLASYGMLAKVIEQRGMSFAGPAPDPPSQGPTEQGTIYQGTMTKQAVYSWQTTSGNAPTYTSVSETWAGMDTGAAVTSYEINQTSSPRTTVVTLPNGTKSKQYSHNAPGQFNDGLIYQDETYDAAGTLLTRSNVVWEAGAYDSPRPARTTTTTRLAGGTELTTGTEFGYGPYYNQVGEVRNYDYGYVFGGANTLLRKTTTQYDNSANYTSRHIYNLPTIVEVYAGDGATRVARTEYTYDGQTLQNTPGVVQHDDAYNPYAPVINVPGYWITECTGCPPCSCRQVYIPPSTQSPYRPETNYRGNVTQVKTYADAANLTGPVVETRWYDINGNVVKASTSCCEETSLSFTPATQYAYPTSQTRGAADPNQTSARITTGATYDFNTGLNLSATDAQGRTTQTGHYPESLRPQTMTLPTGAYTTFSYDDTAMTVSEITYEASGGDVAAQSRRELNGAGAVRREQALGAGGVWDTVDTAYDALGRMWKQTRPYRGGEAPQWSENFYDALGRVTKVRAPDASDSQVFYNEANRPGVASSDSGETTRSVDAWGRERWGRTDAQGRLVEVVEPAPSGNGSVFAAGSLRTSYGYDTLGGLTQVVQGAQTRSFSYDSLGRLTHQKLAEQQATLDGAGTYVGGGQWSGVFAYDDRSNMIWAVDARGVRTNFDYGNDPLNRLQSVSYDTSGVGGGQPAIAAAATVAYAYMPSGDVTRLSQVTAQGVSTEGYGYDAEGRLNAKTLTLASRAAYPLQTNYLYDNLDRVREVTYPKQYATGVVNPHRKVVKHFYDVASRLSELKVDEVTYASDVVYNASSQTTSMRVGAGAANPVNERYDYEAATGLLTSQRVYRGANPEANKLLHLSYDYLREGTAAGRTGQLTKITNHLNALRGRRYSYDALGRLTQAAGGDPGAAPLWTQSYSYDRYGNREGVVSSGVTAKLEEPADPKPTLPADQLAYNLMPALPELSRGANDRRAVSDAGGTSPSSLRLSPTNLLAGALPIDAPTNLTVTSTSATQINLNWTAPAGAVNYYRVERKASAAGTYTFVANSPTTTFTDTEVSAGVAYLYRVQAVDGAGLLSQYGNVALGTTVTFADDPLVAGVTEVRAQHVYELRQAVNAVRATAGLTGATWTDATLEGVFIKAAHVQELRDRLNEALSALSIPTAGWTDATLGAGVTPVRRVHFEELRARATRGSSTAGGGGGSTPVPRDGHETLTYDQTTNRITSAGWEYDSAGNQTRLLSASGWRRMEYDAAGRMVRVTTDGGGELQRVTYGDDNTRLVTEEMGLSTYYAWVGGSVVAEYVETSGQSAPQWSKTYTYFSGRLLSTHTPGVGSEYVEYHHPDRLGTRLVTNQSNTNAFEQVTLPFGTALEAESTGATNRRFTSYDRSAMTGLDYAVNRHFDSLQGRFTQVDPIGVDAVSLGDPQSWNMYAYVGNDPINRTDPDGLFFGKLFKWIGKALKWIAIAAAVAAAIISVYGAIAGVAAANAFVSGTLLGKTLGFIAGLPNAIGGFIAGIPKTIAGIFSLAEAGTSVVAGIVGNAVLLSGGEVAGAVARHLQNSQQRRKLRREAERRAKAAAAEAARRAAEEVENMIKQSKDPLKGTQKGTIERNRRNPQGDELGARSRKAGVSTKPNVNLPRNPTIGERLKFAVTKIADIFNSLDYVVDPSVIAEIACQEDPNSQSCRDFIIFLPPEKRCRYVLCGE